MIYAIIGTGKIIRERAYKELLSLGEVTDHVYSEQAGTLESFISASTLFGSNIIVNVIQCMDVASSSYELLRLLPSMKESSNIFIIDEPFLGALDIKKILPYVEKSFNAVEEKGRGVNLFTLCDLFASRDKKGVWIEWMKVKDVESGEAIQGLLWWKFQSVWADVKLGKNTRFTPTECEVIGKKLLESSILAHRGERDLKVELEKILLSL